MWYNEIDLKRAPPMSTVEAIYVGGVFQPLDDVALKSNQRVRLFFSPSYPKDVASWLTRISTFQKRLIKSHGVLPDSTLDIAAERARHD